MRFEHDDEGKVYRTVVSPALVYGAETWALQEAHDINWTSQKCECYDGRAQLRSWTR